MKKLKFLSLSEQFKLADYDRLEREKDAENQMRHNLENARRRAKGQVINRSESSTEYKNADGQLIREYNYSEKIVVEEQSLGMWLEESPFFTEMKKARTGNAS